MPVGRPRKIDCSHSSKACPDCLDARARSTRWRCIRLQRNPKPLPRMLPLKDFWPYDQANYLGQGGVW